MLRREAKARASQAKCTTWSGAEAKIELLVSLRSLLYCSGARTTAHQRTVLQAYGAIDCDIHQPCTGTVARSVVFSQFVDVFVCLFVDTITLEPFEISS